MTTFNWEQYLANYPDLRAAGIINEKDSWAHYQRFGKSEGRSDSLFNIPITIITPCTRQENLQKIKESIDFSRVCEWIIVYDSTTIQQKWNNDPKISEYFHSNPESVVGNSQRNFALQIVKNKDTFIYFLDDDNLMHPELFKLNLIPDTFYSFNQENGLVGKKLSVGYVDTAMVLIYYPIANSIQWDLNKYHSDGLYFSKLYLANKHKWVYINKSLCYYNKLLSNSFKGYQDLKKITVTETIIPKRIYKTSWYPVNELHQEIKNVLQKTINTNVGYDVYYFDDSEIEQFLGEYDPTFRCLRAFKKLIPGAFKSDFFRYCLLDKYGGCYSDIGHQCLEPFETVCRNESLVLVKEIKNLGIHNGFICCVPGHPLMKYAVNKCLYNIENEVYGTTDISITGPTMLNEVYSELIEKIRSGYNRDIPVKMLYHCIINEKKYIKESFSQKLEDFCIVTKFDNYDSIMYPNGRLDYHQLWNSRNVFKKV